MSSRPLLETLLVSEDHEWERTVLGPRLAPAREALARQLHTGRPDTDPRPILQRALRSVPYYQQVFQSLGLGAHDLDDPRALALVPPTRREDLRDRLPEFLSYPVDHDTLERGWRGYTSGSTGEPVAYFRPPVTIAWFYPFVDFALAYVGRPPVVAGPRAGIVQLDALGLRPPYGVTLPLFHGTRFEKLDASDGNPDLRAQLTALAPRVITGDPQSIARLVEFELPPETRPDLVISSAFTLPSELSAAVTEATGAEVLDTYCSQETSLVGLSCRLGRGFHLVSGASHVETLPIPGSGETEILVTPLDNPAFVLLRYAPGDLGRLVDDGQRCPCGLSGRRLTELRGRTATLFDAVDGGSFAPGQLNPLLSRLPVAAFQMEQHRVDRYTLKLCSDRLPSPALVAPIRASLERLAGDRVEIELTLTESPVVRGGNKPEPFRRAVP